MMPWGIVITLTHHCWYNTLWETIAWECLTACSQWFEDFYIAMVDLYWLYSCHIPSHLYEHIACNWRRYSWWPWPIQLNIHEHSIIIFRSLFQLVTWRWDTFHFTGFIMSLISISQTNCDLKNGYYYCVNT